MVIPPTVGEVDLIRALFARRPGWERCLIGLHSRQAAARQVLGLLISRQQGAPPQHRCESAQAGRKCSAVGAPSRSSALPSGHFPEASSRDGRAASLLQPSLFALIRCLRACQVAAPPGSFSSIFSWHGVINIHLLEGCASSNGLARSQQAARTQHFFQHLCFNLWWRRQAASMLLLLHPALRVEEAAVPHRRRRRLLSFFLIFWAARPRAGRAGFWQGGRRRAC